MAVNSDSQTPHGLDPATAKIMQMIGIDQTDQEQFRKVKRFIHCNGYLPVWRSAEITRRRLDELTRKRPAERFADPWGYTVSTFNTSLAFLQILYPLSHWVESGLRSQLDMYYTRTKGSRWYCTPSSYLRGNQISFFVNDVMMPAIKWARTAGAPSNSKIEEMDNSGTFLESLTFGWLSQIAQFCHKANAQSILVPLDGKPLPATAVESRLEDAKIVRNIIAHNRFMGRENFEHYHKTLKELTEILHFDVDHALGRVAARRATEEHKLSTQAEGR